MKTVAVVVEKPHTVELEEIDLAPAGDDDILVESLWSGVSTGTEKLLFNGAMPAFPGLNYPLVPGYETVARIVRAPSAGGFSQGGLVFVPGARCYNDAAALFGASASRLHIPAARAVTLPQDAGPEMTLLALAATAHHALALTGARAPELVVGHGVLGRLIARIAIALGHEAPLVWEIDPARSTGASGYEVSAPGPDGRKFTAIIDASGDSAIIDKAVAVMKPQGELTLAGFYGERLSFAFAPAFMREASIRIAAEFHPEDIRSVLALLADGRLDLSGLVTDVVPAATVAAAYPEAFRRPDCLKMVLDWRQAA